jgi:hypothetical protein
MNKMLSVLSAALFVALFAVPGSASAQEAADKGAADKAAAPDEKAGGDVEAGAEAGIGAEAGTEAGAGTEVEAAAEEEGAVVADDEEAEKKAEAEKAALDKPSPIQGTWTKKLEFSSEDGNFKFQPTGFVQPKLQMLIVPDEDDAMAGSGFVLNRARFGFRAGLFKFAKLALDADFKTGTFGLVDFYSDIDPWNGIVAFRVGRFRPWFCRQLLAASSQLQMIENAKAWSDPLLGMGLDRDLGVGVFGLVADTFEYGIGVWNGDGGSIFDTGKRELSGTLGIDRENLDRPLAPLVAPGNIDVVFGGRLAVHPLAPAGIGRTVPLGDESDGAISDKPGLAIGVSALFNKRHDRVLYDYMMDINGTPTKVDFLYYDNQLKLGVDLAFQMIGLSFVGEFFIHKVWLAGDAAQQIQDAIDLYGGVNPYPTGSTKKAATTGALVDGLGFGAYAQAGYFVIAKKLELAARFDMVDESTDVRGMRLFPGIGATYYFFGNNLKLQFMYRLGVPTGYAKKGDSDAIQVEDVINATTTELVYVDDPGYSPMEHGLFLMLQGSI